MTLREALNRVKQESIRWLKSGDPEIIQIVGEATEVTTALAGSHNWFERDSGEQYVLDLLHEAVHKTIWRNGWNTRYVIIKKEIPNYVDTLKLVYGITHNLLQKRLRVNHEWKVYISVGLKYDVYLSEEEYKYLEGFRRYHIAKPFEGSLRYGRKRRIFYPMCLTDRPKMLNKLLHIYLYLPILSVLNELPGLDFEEEYLDMVNKACQSINTLLIGTDSYVCKVTYDLEERTITHPHISRAFSFGDDVPHDSLKAAIMATYNIVKMKKVLDKNGIKVRGTSMKAYPDSPKKIQLILKTDKTIIPYTMYDAEANIEIYYHGFTKADIREIKRYLKISPSRYDPIREY